MRYDRGLSPRRRGVMARVEVVLGGVVLGSSAVALVLAGPSPAAARTQQSAPAAAVLVFDGVTVVDVEQGKLVPAQRVVITGNRIQAVGSSGAVKLPKGAQVVDARGKYLIPGLWDMHVHTAADLPYLLHIANGVTGIRDAWARVPLDTMLQWRREILAGTRVGPPRQLLSGSAINTCRKNEKESGGEERGWAGHVCTMSGDSAGARRLVEKLKAAGVDMLKMYTLEKKMYFAIAAEARRLGIPFGGHIEALGKTPLWSAIEASDSGARVIDHNLFGLAVCWTARPVPGPYNKWGEAAPLNEEQCQRTAEQFQKNGTWFVPTLYARPFAKHFYDRIHKFWAGASLQGNWLRDAPPELPPDSLGALRLMHRVGMPILASSHTSGPPYIWRQGFGVPGFMLHVELATLVAEGLPPLVALQSATLNPAKLLRGTDSLGTVAAGKLADLVLLDADPLADITNTTTIRAVVANGRYFDRAALDQLLADVRATSERGVSAWDVDGSQSYGKTMVKR